MPTVTSSEQQTPEQALRDGGDIAVLEAARRVSAELAANAEASDRAGSFAHENYQAIWSAGLGNLTLPAEHGGVGARLELTAEVIKLLAAGDASTALVLVMHLVHLKLLDALAVDESPELVDAIYTSSLAGPALANALRVEPDLGTPARGGIPATRAEAIVDEEGRPAWRISGHKTYCTGSHGLRWMLIWGTTKSESGDDLIGFFAVPGQTPGVEIRETWDHLGMRGTASHDVLLDGVVIPREYAFALSGGSEHLVARPRVAGLGSWLTVLLLAVYHGAATAGRDWLVSYLHERVPSNLGKPLSTLPRFQSSVGELDALLASSERLYMTLARESDAGGEAAVTAAAEASIVKVMVTRDLIEAMSLAVSLVGNAGLSYHHPLQRHFRDVLCSRIHTPQDDSVLLAVGRSALERAAE